MGGSLSAGTSGKVEAMEMKSWMTGISIEEEPRDFIFWNYFIFRAALIFMKISMYICWIFIPFLAFPAYNRWSTLQVSQFHFSFLTLWVTRMKSEVLNS